ncbi:Protein NRT1/ PTR FAMILY 8.1 [Striga hermonthica]|uniref:Protein NRT1/ PTR FAMILY 8.1 n=1 Tax=Striga hermonthica TaxID=68872 RepID=A0A9N7P5Z2_STRHE|nr:Protein NRT1/ PTR FAMILY 8.1 [Striga hermonthica]
MYETTFCPPLLANSGLTWVFVSSPWWSICQRVGRPESPSLVSNGCFDYKGRIADKRKTGGWKAAPFIIVNEVAERFAFFSIAVNMVAYLVGEMHQPLPEAAAHVGNWVGAAYILTLFGAFMADAYLGRFQTIITFSCIYAVGMVLLTLSGSIPGLRPPQCTLRPCPPATSGQTSFLYLSLALIAVGTGGIKPCVSSFGADQFDEADPAEARHKYSFFNWYRYQRPAGSAFTRFAQVIVAAVRNRVVEVGGGLYEVEESKECEIHGATKLAHTQQYRFLDKAAVVTDPAHAAAGTRNQWRLCTVTQVEELKCIVRIIPVWASTIALAISYSQISTFFVAQAATMDRSLSPTFSIPAGSTPVFSAVNALLVVPLYERLAVPLLRARTGHPRGITSLQRIGAGLLVSVPAMVSAAVVERNRRSTAGGPRPSVFWLFPQCFLMGMAEVLAYVGQLEFFYDEATDGTRSISSAVFLSEFGIGSWLSSALVEIVGRTTGGAAEGWLRDDLNQSRLDNFYWLLAGINVVNFAVYLWVARRYKGRRVAEPAVAAAEELGGGVGLQNGKGEESI